MTEQHAPAQGTGNHEAVLRIAADVLKVPRITEADSFYDFGGTSLQAMRICARIGKELGVRVTPETLFECDTFAEVVAAIDV
ncbi:acyl carrier protein [Streptomyces paludis]|uniref:acyl carrier protein n=1 Tax=Streptomyces paludis TaxID=2282738 RepID=UPI0013B43DA0|nr:acyl carrier protein [Streptomyces paludis]